MRALLLALAILVLMALISGVSAQDVEQVTLNGNFGISPPWQRNVTIAGGSVVNWVCEGPSIPASSINLLASDSARSCTARQTNPTDGGGIPWPLGGVTIDCATGRNVTFTSAGTLYYFLENNCNTEFGAFGIITVTSTVPSTSATFPTGSSGVSSIGLTSQSGSTVATSQSGSTVATSQSGSAVATSQSGSAVTSQSGSTVATSQSGSAVATSQSGSAVTSQSGSAVATSQSGSAAASTGSVSGTGSVTAALTGSQTSGQTSGQTVTGSATGSATGSSSTDSSGTTGSSTTTVSLELTFDSSVISCELGTWNEQFADSLISEAGGNPADWTAQQCPANRRRNVQKARQSTFVGVIVYTGEIVDSATSSSASSQLTIQQVNAIAASIQSSSTFTASGGQSVQVDENDSSAAVVAQLCVVLLIAALALLL